MFQKMHDSEYAEKVIGGDFNLVLQPDIDRKNCKESRIRAMDVVRKSMKIYEYSDPWRILHPDIEGYTWKRKMRNKNDRMYARLDYFLTSQTLINRIVSARHKGGYNTDHSLITIEIRPGVKEQGCGFWKLNSKLLDKTEYKKAIKEVLHKAVRLHGNANPQTKWELYKCETTEFTQCYAKKAAREAKEEYKMLIEKIDFLERQTNMAFTADIDTELSLCHRQLDAHLQKQLDKHIAFSKAKWYMYGERSNKFFFSLAKARYNNKTMHSLLVDGHITTDPDIILKEQAKFYQKLYTNDSKVNFTLKRKSNRQITEDQKSFLDSPITLKELKDSLSHFAFGKTPGCDGLTAEYYVEFWEEIKQPYLDALNHGIENRKLHVSAR